MNTTSTEHSKQIVRRSLGILCVAVVFLCNFKSFAQVLFASVFVFRFICSVFGWIVSRWRRKSAEAHVLVVVKRLRKLRIERADYTHIQTSVTCNNQHTDRQSPYKKRRRTTRKTRKKHSFYNAQYVQQWHKRIKRQRPPKIMSIQKTHFIDAHNKSAPL